MGTVFREIVTTRAAPRPPFVVDSVPNLLTSTLYVRPFGQSEWPAVRQSPRVSVESPPNLLTSLYYVAPAAPFKPPEWPAPRQIARTNVVLTVPNLLSGLLVVPKVPFAPAGLPLITCPPRTNVTLVSPNLLTSTLYNLTKRPKKPFLPRVPGMNDRDFDNRFRRFTELLSIMINSLVATDQITQLGANDFEINAMGTVSSSGLTGTFNTGAF